MFKTVEALHDNITNRGFYPLTHEQAVIGNDEVNLETKLKNINNEISNIDDVISNIDISYSKQYLTFTALEDTTFTFTQNELKYSLDDGTTWTTLDANTASPTVTAGNKILWKQTQLTPTYDGIGTFSATGNFDVSGNIMSLYYGDNFAGQNDLTGKSYAFYRLFYNCNKLINTKNLILPATILADSCYYGMFWGCTSLTTAPELIATTLAQSCYGSMFMNCTALTKAPELPATTLAYKCYNCMFQSCTALTKAPELPATTLVSECYYGMFQYCTALTKAPELPATTLANYCYQNMFRGCTALTTAPELHTTTLVNKCYLTMFQGCTALNYIKCLATDVSATDCTKNWVISVAATGTFVKADSMTSWSAGNYGIPNGWTVYTESEWKEVKHYELDAAISNITHPVTSVNGQTGAVSLTIPSEVTESTVSGWGFTKNTGTLTSETQLSKGTATGAGNAVTDINVSNHQITLVKGATYATQNDIDTSIAALVNSAPTTLDTLNELAAALGNDANFSTTVSTQIGNKISKVSNPTADNFASFNSDGTIKDSGHSHSDYITSIKTVNNESLVGSGNIVISGLPAVSSSDNGKILMVVNGQWQLVSPSVLYSGSGVPNNSNGNNGDIYIQTD